MFSDKRKRNIKTVGIKAMKERKGFIGERDEKTSLIFIETKKVCYCVIDEKEKGVTNGESEKIKAGETKE